MYCDWFLIFSNSTINNVILFFTFLALLFYAWETKKIREIEEKPIIDLFYRPKQRSLKLRNTGKGTAYNIKVESIEAKDQIFWFYFDDPNLILVNGCEQFLYVNTKDRQNSSYKHKDLDGFLNYISDRKSFNKDKRLTEQQKQEIIISYKNALGKKFKTIFYVYNRYMSGVDEVYEKDIEIEFKEKEINNFMKEFLKI